MPIINAQIIYRNNLNKNLIISTHIFPISSLFFISSLQFSIHSQSANINNFDQPCFTTRNAILPRSNPFLLIQQFGRDRFETRNNTVDRMATTSKSSLSIVLYQGRWLRPSGHGSSIHSRKYCQPEVMRPGDKRKWREKARMCVCACYDLVEQANTSWKRMGIGGEEVWWWMKDDASFRAIGRYGGREEAKERNGWKKKGKKAVDEGPQIIT